MINEDRLLGLTTNTYENHRYRIGCLITFLCLINCLTFYVVALANILSAMNFMFPFLIAQTVKMRLIAIFVFRLWIIWVVDTIQLPRNSGIVRLLSSILALLRTMLGRSAGSHGLPFGLREGSLFVSGLPTSTGITSQFSSLFKKYSIQHFKYLVSIILIRTNLTLGFKCRHLSHKIDWID